MSFEVLRVYIAICGSSILTILVVFMLLFNDFFKKIKEYFVKHEKAIVISIFIVGIIGYIATVLGYFGVFKYVKDFDVFLMWSRMMNDDGLKGFMVEYPAGGLYLLAALQFILRLFKVADNYIITVVFMKLPSILATLAIGLFAYKWSKIKYDDATPILILILIVFNPVFLINASMWGQIDMVLILLIVVALHFLKQEKIILSIIFYTLGCLIKAQMIFFAPVFGMFLIMPLFNKITRKKTLRDLGLGIIISITIFTIATLPFKNNITDIWIIDFFKHISSEHPYSTASALNLFGLHGGNAMPDTNNFLFLNYRIWGYIFIAAVCVFCAYLVVRDYKNRRVFLLSAFCMTAVYTLGVSMHERYILPVIVLFAISYLYNKDKWMILFAGLYTITATINQCMIILDLFGGKTWTFRLFSGVNVAIFALLIYFIIRMLLKQKLMRNKT